MSFRLTPFLLAVSQLENLGKIKNNQDALYLNVTGNHKICYWGSSGRGSSGRGSSGRDPINIVV